ncbi:unnamed protein product [Candidula unifasciata]|uniref:PDZ domain-containing protein n=1 Tax=Candidula unifasciata TaxID=100452 RepID=A0A8S3ZKK5_9EUPU|nr:unnamed protein product [Candidula unifasciata]
MQASTVDKEVSVLSFTENIKNHNTDNVAKKSAKDFHETCDTKLAFVQPEVKERCALNTSDNTSESSTHPSSDQVVLRRTLRQSTDFNAQPDNREQSNDSSSSFVMRQPRSMIVTSSNTTSRFEDVPFSLKKDAEIVSISSSAEEFDNMMTDSGRHSRVSTDELLVDVMYDNYDKRVSANDVYHDTVHPILSPTITGTQGNSLLEKTTPATENSSHMNIKSPVTSSQELAPGIHKVVMMKGATGVGFCIEGGVGSLKGDMPIFIKRIFKGGPAEKCGQLKVRDEILEVNGVKFHSMRHYEAWNHLKFLDDGAIQLTIRRPSS